MRKNVKTELEKAFRKAERFRRENKDIPKLAEICIYFGIEREELKNELSILMNEASQEKQAP